MVSSLVLVMAALGVALPSTQACTYWCMNPVTRGYECCDAGNPWYTAEVEEPVEAEVEVVDTKSPVEAVEDVESAAPSGTSSGCIYYCAYNGQVYCCDNGENPLPTDHKDHAGKCPTEKEQSCKVSASDKKPTGKISSVFVDKYDKMCASDGYCAEEERCCPNKCHKKHTCMPSF